MDGAECNNIELTTSYGKKKKDKPYVQEIPEEVMKLFGMEEKKDDKRKGI